jgi:peptidyl-dipeptidase Dcp
MTKTHCPPKGLDLSPNPLLEDWTASGGVPPFDRITAEHFTPAYARALAEHEAEIAAIAGEPAPPTFANTIVTLELSGRLLDRVGNAFRLLAGAHSNDALLEIERDMAPQIARHWNKIRTDAVLFRRIDHLMRDDDRLGLDAEQKRVIERYHTDFRRAGAGLDTAAKKRLAEIIERLAALGTAFSQNVLADEQAFALPLDGEAELSGLPDFMRETLRSEAHERDLDGYAVTLSRSTVEPFLQFFDRRDLREKAFRGFVMRGDNGSPTDNKAIIAEMVRLRAERAQLLGYRDFAHYRLDDAMAKTPGAVRNLLDTVWAPARASALADHDRDGETAAPIDLCRRRSARARRRLQSLPRSAAERRRAATQARLCRAGPGGELKYGQSNHAKFRERA